MKAALRFVGLSLALALGLLVPTYAQIQPSGFIYCWIWCPEGAVQLWLATEDQCCKRINLCPASGAIGEPYEVGGYNYEGGYEVPPQTCI